jgi:signal transduction histidine kinase
MKDASLTETDNLTHQIVCLRNISRLFFQSDDFDQTLETLVHLIPEGWQYPSETTVRIIIGDQEIRTTNFTATQWMLSSPIRSSNGDIGAIEVFYLNEKPEAHEGPFLKIERTLLETIAAELGSYIERAQIERTRIQQHKELELYSSLLRHDLRNDLAIVFANIDAIRLLSSDRSEIVEELLISSEVVCERMLNLLTVFGKSSKTTEGRITTLIRQVARQAQEANNELRIKITVDPDDEELKIPESKLLAFVFDNLFRNAVLHAGDRPIVEVEITRNERKVQIIISDNGPGIADEIRDQLFSRGVSTREGGGLGLYLTRNVLEVIDGSIELVDSRNGSGATFRILLPLEF